MHGRVKEHLCTPSLIKVISFLNVSYIRTKTNKDSHYHTILYAEEFKSTLDKGFVFLFTAPLKIMCNGPLMIAGIKMCSMDREKGRHARRNAK